MRDYLVHQEGPDFCIVVDNYGNDTEQTATDTLRFRRRWPFQREVLVYQCFQLTRCKMLFRKQGILQVTAVAPRYVEARDLFARVRECVACYVEGLR